jgi:hypothetical protein
MALPGRMAREGSPIFGLLTIAPGLYRRKAREGVKRYGWLISLGQVVIWLITILDLVLCQSAEEPTNQNLSCSRAS